ncbi:MAG TPA: hypothetical protein VGB95_02865, partial [Chitinophagales bacterium]
MIKNFYKICSAAFLTAGLAIGAAAQVSVVSVQDSISTDTHWTCDNQYLLKGYVYVTNGTTLTIDPGVIIKGDKQTKGALIVERGAKIQAIGTAEAPIVFTSNEAVGSRSYGDWGGVIICGKAPQNWSADVENWSVTDHQVEGGPRSLYGGNTPDDNSGALSYVRIEFPGIAFSPNNEVNGLSLYAVGSGTQIDHVQVSYSGDDAVEFFGGRVNTKYMVAYSTWDDDFDTDNGYQGLNQYGVVLRDPFAADQSGSKAFESDSWQSGTIAGRNAADSVYLTKPVFTNFTAIGALVSPTSTAYDPNYVAALHTRRGTSISILNSVIAGFPIGVLIDEPDTASFGSTIANWTSGSIQFKNNALAGMPIVSSPAANAPADQTTFFVYGDNRRNANGAAYTTAPGDTAVFFGRIAGAQAGPISTVFAAANKNKEYATQSSGIRLQNPFNLSNPDFAPTSTSPIVYNNSGHTFNPANPISLDTTGNYANYNAPDLIPNSSSYRLQNSFFETVNHIGA